MLDLIYKKLQYLIEVPFKMLDYKAKKYYKKIQHKYECYMLNVDTYRCLSCKYCRYSEHNNDWKCNIKNTTLYWMTSSKSKNCEYFKELTNRKIVPKNYIVAHYIWDNTKFVVYCIIFSTIFVALFFMLMDQYH